MDTQITELEKKVDTLTQINADLAIDKQKYQSAKQSFIRMSARLRKLCKRLTATTETVLEMQKIAAEIRDFANKIT